eukprot:TRINITY_DN10914_c0_g1_i1.p1 TRINITY_DN10914_c0_g1~~TRINITY_DN10914_c0_g1_i1.p1  ORF type:complete len:655 (-),score=114.59 TRINITY_DN10914_c0_g1_i1:132-2027(-)
MGPLSVPSHSLLLLLLLLLSTVSAACVKSHPLVGYSGPLSTKAHQVAGTVRIVDDCTFEVLSFRYDGGGPAVYWWGGSPSLSNGAKVVDQLLSGINYRGVETESFTLSPGLTWDSFTKLSVYCVDFNANFGDVFLESLEAPVDSSCDSTHDLVGKSATLSSLEHDVGGVVQVIDDCTFEVTQFTYDGTGPAAYWYAGNPSLVNGFKVNEEKLDTVGNPNRIYTYRLNEGLTWDSFTVLSVYCISASQEFGSVQLSDFEVFVPPPPPPVTTSCLTVLPGMLNVEWKILGANSTELEVTLISSLPEGTWVGFGFSPLDQTQTYMPDSDVTIVGRDYGSTGVFVKDYFLERRAQCTLRPGETQYQGVCPDSILSGDYDDEDSVLIKDEVLEGVSYVTYSRPLTAKNEYDIEILNDQLMWITAAKGPISDVLSQEVLYHQPNRIDPSPGLQINFYEEYDSCQALEDVVIPERTEPEVLPFPTDNVFNIRNGTNKNYPNPPAWSVSYWVNEKETPIMRVVRGETYTINLTAGPLHPLYFTTSKLGGNDPDETIIFDVGVGSDVSPFTTTWTVGLDAPDLFYYQCVTHPKIGWEVRAYDEAFTTQGPSSLSSSSSFWSPPSAFSFSLLFVFMWVLSE